MIRHERFIQIVAVLITLLMSAVRAEAQSPVDPMTAADHATHRSLLDLKDPVQNDRADAAFTLYQQDWQHIVDTQETLLLWEFGLYPRTWRGWDQGLHDRVVILFPHEEFAARRSFVAIDQVYFQQLTTAAPWAGDMAELLSFSRARQRCHAIAQSSYLGKSLGHYDPVGVLVDLKIPIRRETELRTHLDAYASEFADDVHELELATTRRFRSLEAQRASLASTAASRTKSLEASTEEIEAIVAIRSEPARLAHALRDQALIHVGQVTASLDTDDAIRFHDRAMRDLYPMLLNDSRDLTQVVARIRQRHEFPADIDDALDEIVLGFRADRDHHCRQSEPIIDRATNHDRIATIWRASERRRWTGEYTFDPRPDADLESFVRTWNARVADWRQRITDVTGLDCREYGDPVPSRRWTPEDSFNYASRGMDGISRDVIAASELFAIIESLLLDDETSKLMTDLASTYDRSLRAENDRMRQAYIDGDVEAMNQGSDWYINRYELENQMIDDIQAILDDEALDAFTTAIRSHRRTLAMRSLRSQRRGYWRFDLIALADNCNIADRPELQPLLREYAANMDEAIETWGSVSIDALNRATALRTQGTAMEEWFPIYQEASRTIDTVAEINRKYTRLITGLHDADAAQRFTRAVHGANLMQLGEPSPVDLAAESVLAADDLEAAVEREVAAAYATYEQQYGQLLTEFWEHQQFWEQPERVEAYQQQRDEIFEARQIDRTIDPNAAGLGHPGLATLEQMLDLVIDTMAEVRAIIGDDIYNDLPPAIRLCIMCYDVPPES